VLSSTFKHFGFGGYYRPKLNAAFQGGGQTRQVTLAQTMPAFTLEKPRSLGTRKRGFGSTNFNGKTLRPNFYPEKSR
jgi:hypothetical protein